LGKKEIYEKAKHAVASLPQFDLKCGVCHKKFGKYFVFHHKRYLTGDKIYSAFKDSYSYNEYVLPIIKSDPDRFSLLCRKHHRVVEMMKMFKPETFNRLVKIVKEST